MSLKIKVLGNASQIGLPPVEARPGYVFTLDPSCDDYDAARCRVRGRFRLLASDAALAFAVGGD